GGLRVYPRLVAADHLRHPEKGLARSGVEALDDLLGGGLERGTSALLIGSAGTGKSSPATQYAVTAAEHGERPLMLLLEDTFGTWLARSEALGFAVRPLLRQRLLEPVPVQPAAR